MRRVVGFGVVAAGVVGFALYLMLAPMRPQLSRAEPAPGGGAVSQGQGQPVQVMVGMDGFTPNTIRFQAGQAASLRFINPDSRFHTDGGGWHQFRVEALGIDVKIPPQSEKVVNLGALKPGSYVFYCDVCCGGKANPSMQGVLEVST